ncbi:hypothetical protein Ddye_006735 [Dipteronia dyeriana]|uniref:Uncharacterized protein n=1 Tax=Dipteronia dyeriana TaxID=168575 RepID=A0AAD9XIX9_9ROSI|nr:hypothetical protein Ddye_006735 [Dipteronia dyeriana]
MAKLPTGTGPCGDPHFWGGDEFQFSGVGAGMRIDSLTRNGDTYHSDHIGFGCFTADCASRGLQKSKGRVENQVGDSRLLNDADLSKLAYLHSTISETLRLGLVKVPSPWRIARRVCSGEGLGMRVMALSLGTLIQCFDWEKVKEDQSQAPVKTNPKKADERHVKIIFRPREALAKVLTQL